MHSTVPRNGRSEWARSFWIPARSIFMTQRARLAPAATELLQAASAAGGGSTYISPITAWEVGMLTAHGRLQLLIRPERWFANLFEAPGVRLADMSADVLIASSYLPGRPPRRSDRPHHRRDRARARRHPGHPRPRAARLRRARPYRGGGVLRPLTPAHRATQANPPRRAIRASRRSPRWPLLRSSPL